MDDVGRLRDYHAKRDAARTPEPMPAAARPRRRSGAPVFVVQEHRAGALHWDFRLERDGVLVSWALPKGVPADPRRDHRAVHTEDHPMEYADFEGRIPAGEYGAGTVRAYDRGTYDTVKWEDDEVKVELHGERLTGRYTLFRAGTADDWMIHREKGQDPDAEPIPDGLLPMAAGTGPLPAGRSAQEWAAEFKWDGVRALCRISGGRLRIRSRRGNDVTDTYPELKALAGTVSTARLLLDGEIIALDDSGKVSFAALQPRFGTSGAEAGRLARTHPVSLMIFDLLHLDGRPTTDLPYADRRRLLEGLELAGPHWQTPPSFAGTPASDVLAAARAAGLEGVVLKRLASPYRPGTRSPDWRKVKLVASQSAVIGGFTPLKSESAPAGAPPREIGALLLGVPGEDGRLRYAGKVGSGFTERDRRTLLTELSHLAVAASPFTTAVEPADARIATWVEPVVVAEVTFTDWTAKGRLRHPVFKGVRPDVAPEEVVREP
jgi:bifunctional non-homologous end joining protein LigD